MSGSVLQRFAVFILLAMAVGSPAHAADSSRHVVIITLDGCRPSMSEDDYALTLKWLSERGCYTWQAQTVMPSVTMVAHASLLTGLLPSHHGVASNRFEADAGGWKATTLLELARKEGLKTAFIASKQKLRHLDKPNTANFSAYPHSELEELGYDPKKPDIPPRAPFDTVRAVRSCFGSIVPNVIFIHFAEPDLTGHNHGWESDEYMYAFRQVDQKIGMLLQDWRRIGFLENNTMVIVTSDHGGHGKTHGTDDPRDMTIPWIVWGPSVRQNHELLTPVRIDDTAATAAFFLKLKIPKEWDGRVITEIFR